MALGPIYDECLGGGPKPWRYTSPRGGGVFRHALPMQSWHSRLIRLHMGVHRVNGQDACLFVPHRYFLLVYLSELAPLFLYDATDEGSCIAVETFGCSNHPWLVKSDCIISHDCT